MKSTTSLDLSLLLKDNVAVDQAQSFIQDEKQCDRFTTQAPSWSRNGVVGLGGLN